jgi:hypothetical protein
MVLLAAVLAVGSALAFDWKVEIEAKIIETSSKVRIAIFGNCLCLLILVKWCLKFLLMYFVSPCPK